jgi:MFS family permease
MPAIVALVAANFPAIRRPAVYGLIAAAGAMAVAAGALIGGAVTTFFSWRWVFAGEVVLVPVILLFSGRIVDQPSVHRPHIDVPGAALSTCGLALTVFRVLRSSEWGWVQAKPGGPQVLGVSPVVWLVLGGLLIRLLRQPCSRPMCRPTRPRWSST